MNRLFERCVERIVARAVGVAARLETQAANGSIVVDADGRTVKRLRPDLVLRWSDGPTVVADAKYKDLGPQQDASREDIAQVFLYTAAIATQAVPQGVIIHPTIGDHVASRAFRCQGPDAGTLAWLRVLAIPMRSTLDEIAAGGGERLDQIAAALRPRTEPVPTS